MSDRRHHVLHDPEGLIVEEFPLDRKMHLQLAGAVVVWRDDDPLPPDDYDHVALLLSGAARSVAGDLRRLVELLPEEEGARVLAEILLDETERRLSQPPRGTLHCAQHRARLVRGLYERLDRLEAAAPTAPSP
ncbi:restriction endonuclease [Streptomyces sp. NPDC013489]|uniref:restriction endonuclease n=1 Tax=Streptomyces sp. NPDC013489 TaxID=3155606 RepID=UPI0033DEE15C